MRRTALALGIVTLAAIAGWRVAAVDVPMLLNYQGRLVDKTTGLPLDGVNVKLEFSIFNVAVGGAPLGTPAWLETHASVPVVGGIFNVILGSVTPFPSDLFPATPAEAAGAGPVRFLEVEVNDEILIPRHQIVSSAYAIVGPGGPSGPRGRPARAEGARAGRPG